MVLITIPPYNEFLRFALERIIREEPHLDLRRPGQEILGERPEFLPVERNLPVVCLCHGLEYMLKIGAHVQAVRVCGDDNGIKGCHSLSTLLGVAEKPVFPVMFLSA